MSRTTLTKEERTARDLEKFTIREEMFQLVVKIISWKTKSIDSQSVQNQDKISALEWEQYEKHLLEISKTEGIDNIKKKLILIRSQIESNHGFK